METSSTKARVARSEQVAAHFPPYSQSSRTEAQPSKATRCQIRPAHLRIHLQRRRRQGCISIQHNVLIFVVHVH